MDFEKGIGVKIEEWWGGIKKLIEDARYLILDTECWMCFWGIENTDRFRSCWPYRLRRSNRLSRHSEIKPAGYTIYINHFTSKNNPGIFYSACCVTSISFSDTPPAVTNSSLKVVLPFTAYKQVHNVFTSLFCSLQADQPNEVLYQITLLQQVFPQPRGNEKGFLLYIFWEAMLNRNCCNFSFKVFSL